MITIIGAGMAGLIAGCMIRDHLIVEAQPELPNNHHAVLRFRSSVVGDTLNVPFKRVKMMKCVHPWRNPVADQLSYSIKTNGSATLRSAISADGAVAERFIAPPDLIQRMAEMCKLKLGEPADFNTGTPIISTIPMPALMDALGWGRKPEFHSRKGIVVTQRLRDVEAYCSVYDPDPQSAVGRVSLTGDLMMVECYPDHPDLPVSSYDVIARALQLIGVPERNLIGKEEIKRQTYAKILPIDEETRKRFIMWASDEFGIYSLGRFATWRPGLLLDDIVNDVRVIQRLINGGSSYHHKMR